MKRRPSGGGRWRRWLGAAGLFVAVVAAVTVLTIRKEEGVYRTEPPAQVEAGDRVMVEVLNGCGAAGAAKVVAEELRIRGFDVVKVGNAADFDYPVTIVIDRSGSIDKALRVAHSLGCSRVIRQVASDAFLDVTVIIGADGVWRKHRLDDDDPRW